MFDQKEELKFSIEECTKIRVVEALKDAKSFWTALSNPI